MLFRTTLVLLHQNVLFIFFRCEIQTSDVIVWDKVVGVAKNEELKEGYGGEQLLGVDMEES